MFSIIRSDSARAEPSGLVCIPNSLRMKFITEFVKRSSAVNLSPFGDSAASCIRNSGLLNASATNSSRFVVPYAEPSSSFTDSNKFVNCLVIGCDLLANVADVAAWVISCSTVWTFIPDSALSDMVFVFGSNLPAASNLSATLTLVSPTTPASFSAALRTRVLRVVLAIYCSALPRLPASRAIETSGCKGIDEAATASDGRSRSSFNIAS